MLRTALVTGLLLVTACSATPDASTTASSAIAATNPAKVSILIGTPGGAGTADGVGANARFRAPAYLRADPRGGAFLVDQGALRHVGDDGTVTTIDASPQSSSAEVVVDADGNVYDVNAAFDLVRIDAKTGAHTTLAKRFYIGPGGASRDALYGFNYGQLKRFDLATQTTTLIAGAAVSGYVDGTGAAARFSTDSNTSPVFDGQRYVYIREWHGNGDQAVVRRVDVTTGETTTLPLTGAEVAWNGDLSLSSDGKRLLVAGAIGDISTIDLATNVATTLQAKGINDLTSAVETKGGHVLAVGYNDLAIHVLDRTTNTLPIFAGSSRNTQYLSSVTEPRLQPLSGLATNGKELIIAETGAFGTGSFDVGSGLRAFDLETHAISEFGHFTGVGILAPFDDSSFLLCGAGWVASGGGSTINVAIAKVGFDGGAPQSLAPASFYATIGNGLAADAAGNVYFPGSTSVEKLDASGTQSKVADGFYHAEGIVFVAPSTLYVADTDNGMLKSVDLGTGAVTTLATGLVGPTGLVRSGTSLFVAETGREVIQKLDLATNQLSVVAGVPNQGGIAAGEPRLNAPHFLAALPDGSLAVGSDNEDVILHVTF